MGMLGSGPIRSADIVNRLLPDLEMIHGISDPLTVPAKLHFHQGARSIGSHGRSGNVPYRIPGSPHPSPLQERNDWKKDRPAQQQPGADPEKIRIFFADAAPTPASILRRGRHGMQNLRISDTPPKTGESNMSKVSPPRNLTPGLCRRIEADMLEACCQVAQKHGLLAESLGVKAMNLRWNFEFGIRVSIPLADGTALNPERILFEALAEEYGLLPDDYGREFSTGRERFRVAGIDPRRPRYPISAERIPDGQGFKFTADHVALLLKAEE
ncbi:hypothetical protein LV780_20660 (plasmid) [Cereibacter azotoformans]|nr:hypothetical protein [Cereibacter azotoformans]UIJ32978.1 hypothetical protein LV780_20660 [Cereibacter azotoformans]